MPKKNTAAKTIKETDKNIDLDTGILDFLNLPEFKIETRERNNKATRIFFGLHYAYDKGDIKSLRDLKRYVEETGWLCSRSYKLARFEEMGEKTVEYFNNTLKKYGLEPFGPLYKN